MLRWSLLTGPLPLLLMIAAAIGAATLLARRGVKHWWTIKAPAIIAGAVLVALGITWYVDHLWQPFPDALPGAVTGWVAAVLAGVGLLVAALVHSSGWRRRAVAVLAVVLIVAAGLNGANRIYGYYPTLAEAMGMPAPGQVPLPPIRQPGVAPSTARDRPAGPHPTLPAGLGRPGDPTPAPATTAPGGTPETAALAPTTAVPLAAVWHPAQRIPRKGVVSEVRIPGTFSHFDARPAWVYLPPAYLVAPRPDLPVLILLPGQPGGPKNWIDAGRVQATMDAFADRHHGLAPVVVLPDPNGSATGNTLCLNSYLGQADTYLSRDVPDWIFSHLQVDRDTAHWAVGGFSYGGTCSFQLAVTHPALFRTFLDISGGVAPTLGSRERDLSLAFHGDLAAYRAAQPLHILAADQADTATADILHRMAGTFVAGTSDTKYGTQSRTVMRECRRAGMSTRWWSEPGSHSWYVAAAALDHEVGWLAARMRLT